jgi:hypothetical protein
MSEHFTEADVDLGVAALWAKQYPYSADLVDCVLTAVAPAMRDRWLTELADEVASWEPVAGWLRSKRSGAEVVHDE